VLNCFGIGTRPMFVSWKKIGDNRYPTIEGGFHAINNVTISDMGVYECTLHNPAGTYRALIRLNIGELY